MSTKFAAAQEATKGIATMSAIAADGTTVQQHRAARAVVAVPHAEGSICLSGTPQTRVLLGGKGRA